MAILLTDKGILPTLYVLTHVFVTVLQVYVFRALLKLISQLLLQTLGIELAKTTISLIHIWLTSTKDVRNTLFVLLYWVFVLLLAVIVRNSELSEVFIRKECLSEQLVHIFHISKESPSLIFIIYSQAASNKFIVIIQ